jgi:small-conductance mechanosensitive channel
MKFRQNGGVILIVLALIAVAYGVRRTAPQAAPPSARSARRAPSDRTIVVDQSSLITAEQLVRMPTTADERPFAEDAIGIADNEMDLAFAQAVRRTLNQPRATTAEAREADARLQHALRALAADRAQLASLTAALAKADVASAESLNDRLDLVKAQAALDQDEADDARQDLRRAGGDPQGRMEEVLAEHDAASKSSDSVRVIVTNLADSPGLVRRVQDLQTLSAKETLLGRAKAAADSLGAAFRVRHDSLEVHAAAMTRDTSARRLSHDSSTALLAATQRLARIGRIRATLDQRVDNQHHLADVYAGWIGVVAAQERMVVNRFLRGVALILVIVLVGMLFARWMASALGAKAGDRRQMHTIYVVTRVSVQVVAVLLIVLVILGPPQNLGTIIGLVGAGLTVALKDFILGFLGWFVLVGRNGIRIGDLVEINGVTGEVMELGMFFTELLETSDYTESGHPTGRRVAFTNGYAIEGHYFNFSTSGRWLWDDVRIVVPAGRDPSPIADALRKEVAEATAESARDAEQEWNMARRSPQGAVPATAASVTLRPIAGGVEISVRYVARVSDRDDVRGRLYRTAMDFLAGVKAVAPAHVAAPAV